MLSSCLLAQVATSTTDCATCTKGLVDIYFENNVPQIQALTGPTIRSLSGSDGYVTLDSIPSGSLGTTWDLLSYYPTTPAETQTSEVVSPYDGSTAFKQEVWDGDCAIRYIRRMFYLGQDYNPESRISFYASFQRYEPQYYDTAAVLIKAMKNGVSVGHITVGSGGGWMIPDHPGYRPVSYPNGFNGVIDIPCTFASEPFDALYVWVMNYTCSGHNMTIFDELKFKGVSDVEVEVTSVAPTLDTLWRDPSGMTSGIVFKAITTEPATVTFKIKNASDTETIIGSSVTEDVSGENVANLSWWGSTHFPAGTYRVIASVGTSTKEATFTIQQVATQLTGEGIKVQDTKDPTKAVNSTIFFRSCPTCPWDQMTTSAPGYPQTLTIADPVNMVSGNYIHTTTDLILKSRMSVYLARIYNSLDPENRGFGRGWSSPYLSRLEFIDSAAIFVNSDGSRVKFNSVNDEYVAVGAGVALSLTYDEPTDQYVLAHPYGSKWRFNTDGKIVNMTSSCCGLGEAGTVQITYTTDGKLHRVTNPANQWIEFEYGSNNKISKIVDISGREIFYAYDVHNNLISFTDPMGRVTAYEYTADGFLTTVTKPDNQITNIQYDKRRVQQVTSPEGEISTFAWNFPAQKLTLTDPHGTEHLYAFDEDWRFVGYSIPSLNIEKSFTITGDTIEGFSNSLGNTRAYTYNSNGLLNDITDTIGYNKSAVYHPTLHLPTEITDSFGRLWRYTWSNKGTLLSETDPDGFVTSYTYDQYNNKITETDPKNRTTLYTYDSGGNFLQSITDPMGDITSFTYDIRGNKISYKTPLGSITENEYDALNREIKTIFNDGRWIQTVYDNAGNVASTIESDGTTTSYTYDKENRILTETNSEGATTSFEYDNAGRRIKTTDALGNVSQSVYDDKGRVLKNINPDNTFTQTIYDSEDRVITTINACGNSTSFEYDTEGRQVATIDALGNRTAKEYDLSGRVVAITNALGRVTKTVYDKNDRVVKTIMPDGSETNNQYDDDGRLLVSIDAFGNQTHYEYNERGQQIKRILPNGAIFTRVYNGMGHEIKTIDPMGNITETLYDNDFRPFQTVDAQGGIEQRFWHPVSGQLIAEKKPDGSITSTTYDILDRPVVTYDANGQPTRTEYDIAGRQVAVVDANGKRTISFYDNMGREIRTIQPEGTVIQRTFNNCGSLLSMTDGAQRTWHYEYDSLNRMVKSTDPAGNFQLFTYTPTSKSASKTNSRGQTTNYEYDVMDRPVKIIYHDGKIATFSYDLLGRELTRSGLGGVSIKTYDSVGNMTSEKFASAGSSKLVGWTYEFDLNGNRVKAIDPDNKITKYYYNKLNQVIKIDFGSCNIINYERDPVGRTLMTDRGQVKTLNTYDNVGRVLTIEHVKSNCRNADKIIASRKYEYDAVGNVLNQIDEGSNKTEYLYNSNYWLTQVKYPDVSLVNYTYNGAGDRLSETTQKQVRRKIGRRRNRYEIATETQTINYTYDVVGRIITRDGDTYAYDTDGNLLSDAVATYTWNSDNRLVKVEKTADGCKHDKYRKGHGYGHYKHGKSSVSYEEYTYLPEDWRRVTRTVGTIKTTGKHSKDKAETFVSVYDGADESHEYEMKKSKYGCYKHHKKINKLKLVKTYISGPGTDDLEFTRSKKKSYAMLKDGLGSTIVLTGKNGKTIARIGYDAWGNFKWSGKAKKSCDINDYQEYLGRYGRTRGFGSKHHNSWGFGKEYAKKITPYLYTGRRYNQFTSQYNNRNRYYQPKYGRFTTKDPIGFGGGYNMYGYVGNNPLKYTDPMGLLSAVVFDDVDPRTNDFLKYQNHRLWWRLWNPAVIQGSSVTSARQLLQKLANLGQIRALYFLGHGDRTGYQIRPGLGLNVGSLLSPTGGMGCNSTTRPQFKSYGYTSFVSCWSAVGIAPHWNGAYNVTTHGHMGYLANAQNWRYLDYSYVLTEQTKIWSFANPKKAFLLYGRTYKTPIDLMMHGRHIQKFFRTSP